MPTVTFEDIEKFALQELWQPSDVLNENTALAHDFGLAGLDGRDFMVAYSRRFGVDLETFYWGEYFGPEGLSVLWLFGVPAYLWRRYVQGRPARELVELPELTLGRRARC